MLIWRGEDGILWPVVEVHFLKCKWPAWPKGTGNVSFLDQYLTWPWTPYKTGHLSWAQTVCMIAGQHHAGMHPRQGSLTSKGTGQRQSRVHEDCCTPPCRTCKCTDQLCRTQYHMSSSEEVDWGSLVEKQINPISILVLPDCMGIKNLAKKKKSGLFV